MKRFSQFRGVLLSAVFVFFGAAAGSAQCVDYDGDGRADACGSTGNVPMPSGIERVDTGGSYSLSGSSSRQQAAPSSHKVHRSAGPSMQTMVATTVFGSLLEAVFMEPAPPPGPTPEQIEAARKLAEQKRLEFERSNRALTRQLKGATYVQDKNITEAGGLKLKTLPPAKSSSGDVHRGFFGSEGSVNPTVGLLRENMDSEWFKGEQGLIEQRMEMPNKWSGAITQSLKTNAPPLPYKKFDELQPGDVLLVNASGASWAIAKGDGAVSGVGSETSHTVLFLREVDGKKHFLENTPGKGPRIIFEDEVIHEYGERGANVAKLAQPLNEREAKDLYSAAVDMAAKNRRDIVGSRFLGTNYGAWGEDNVVCSEADWALLNIARPNNQIPATSDRAKAAVGIDFSPADFYKKGQYFLVSPLDMPKK